MTGGKATQVLNIDPPSELVFRGPFTDVITSYLELSNPSEQRVCFKVKTTAPKQYCVRPNSGFIPSKGSVKVAVMLQPFDYNAEEKTSKHKFMVQTAFAPDGENSLDTIWRNTDANELMDSKLRVLFEMPESATVTESAPVTAKASTPPHKQPSNLEADFRQAVDDNKRLESKIDSLQLENVQLKDRLRFSEAGAKPAGGGWKAGEKEVVQGDVKMLHVVLAALIALLLGWMFGKVF